MPRLACSLKVKVGSSGSCPRACFLFLSLLSSGMEGWCSNLWCPKITVERGMAHSHANFGWETFTDRVIAALNEHREKLVFLLWGSHAQKKGQIIDRTRHLVLTAPHPSPLSAHRGFFGCHHFSKTNSYLESHRIKPIDWQI